MPKLYNIEAEIAPSDPTKVGYRVKVWDKEMGIYINGMMVYPPNPKFPEWGVVPPSMRAGRGRYSYIVEFNKKLPLWEEIYDKCVEVAQLEFANNKDEVITDIPDEPINLDDIPF
jgi:hypothetical protein